MSDIETGDQEVRAGGNTQDAFTGQETMKDLLREMDKVSTDYNPDIAALVPPSELLLGRGDPNDPRLAECVITNSYRRRLEEISNSTDHE
ncbi:hypothetical protein BN7_5652 [Wickerhamomyces ciferrii]|uniref:Uncharacterized protein n=1 Tax=Wickerhamomyces ciferrii (strain ATCC 14091 / BCRC 22168 / CBS 111 / JCM 3599 / NBRC 0793 / NRRL Y-1031 F-60-10) TaxID=1206466 RepID=K0KX53_WICCF|nr:uncharacterized protein BN7_5652 [Wickerhamomyces ciferrii]CCH46064.1 hypothetical protein BN7_5652 [Wickerhamomyces ciferrii]